MKAISLWQPWASWMADGLKLNETRGYSTKHRGDLVICSSKRKPRRQEMAEDWSSPDLDEEWRRVSSLPLGYALCVVEVYDCVPVESLHVSHEEFGMGDYGPGRFAWLTHNCRKLTKPFPVVGRQGFWFLSRRDAKRVKRQVEGV